MVIYIGKLARPLCQLNKLGKHFVRLNSTQQSSKVLECLKNRSLIKLTGQETPSFLQGLTTNDMKSLEEGVGNIYTLFLNFKGRVLYDAIVYKTTEDDVYYIECDSKVIASLLMHLKMYRLKRKISIEEINSQLNVWALFDPNQYSGNLDTSIESKPNIEGLIFPCGSLDNQASKITEDVLIYKDPRLLDLGYRILVKSKLNKNDIAKYLNTEVSSDSQINYISFLYKLGIGEGVAILQQGKSFPLEVNCDYLHGINFYKGCYIGQELTARTYHTGVIRKRLMPLVFSQPPVTPFSYDLDIVNESGKKVGKFKGSEGKYGIGLMRITESLASKTLTLHDVNVKVLQPSWWPQNVEKAAIADNTK